MHRTILGAFLGAMLLVSGCIVPALNPPYLESDLIEDDRIIGTWVGKGGEDGEEWTFTKGPNRSYNLRIAAGGVPDLFVAHLFTLAGECYIDLHPDVKDLGNRVGETLYHHLIPAHTFAKIVVAEDHLMISLFNEAWFQDILDSGETDLECSSYGREGILITADTAALRSFLVARKDEAFAGNFAELVRAI